MVVDDLTPLWYPLCMATTRHHITKGQTIYTPAPFTENEWVPGVVVVVETVSCDVDFQDRVAHGNRVFSRLFHEIRTADEHAKHVLLE